MKKIVLFWVGGFVLFTSGIVGGFFLIFPVVQEGFGDRPQFLIPAKTTLTIEQPGKYYVWNDYRTIFEGRTYAESEELPGGLTVTVADADTRTALPFIADTSTSMESGNSASTSIGYFKVSQAGRYEINVQGKVSPRVFSVGESRFGELFLRILVGGSAVFLVASTGFALIVAGVVKIVLKLMKKRRE